VARGVDISIVIVEVIGKKGWCYEGVATHSLSPAPHKSVLMGQLFKTDS